MENCPTCTNLWRDYAAATHAHIGGESRLKLAKLIYDQDAVSQLLPQVEAAFEERTMLLRRIDEHEVTAHRNSVSAMGSGL